MFSKTRGVNRMTISRQGGFVKLFGGYLKYFKWGSIIIALLSLIGGAWYLTDTYNDALNQVTKLKAEKQQVEQALSLQEGENENLKQRIAKVEQDFSQSIKRREALEEQLKDLESEYDEQVKVFNKERGRFARLFEKKAQLIVNRANAATERLRDEFRKTTTDNKNGN